MNEEALTDTHRLLQRKSKLPITLTDLDYLRVTKNSIKEYSR
jgi:hypothetical protein